MSLNKFEYKKFSQEKLIELAQNNDINALEELLRSEQRDIFATFTYLSKKRQNVSDLTQEALLRIAKNLKNLKNPKHFKSWVNQIVIHLFYDELRKISRAPNIVSIDEDTNEEHFQNLKNTLTDNHCKPNEKCLSNELEAIIRTEINNLPHNFKIAIVLREFQGLSYDEIAQITKSNIGTVKSRISRARIKLQDSLKNYI